MKNKYLYFLQVVIIFFFMIVESVSLEDELVFNTAKIEISDNGSIIYAENGDIFSKKHNITISAKKFKYNKKLSILEANGDIELKDLNEDIILKAQKIFFNIGNETIEVSDNINIRDLNKNISIKTQKVFYNIVNKTIESGTNSVIEDDSNNLFSTENFFFTLDDDLIKLGATKLIDAKKNIMFIEKSYINLNSKKLIGKDLVINFDNASFQKNNEPRLSGSTVSMDKDKTIVKKGVFTTCKRNDDCPPWELLAKEIKHNKNKKIISYKSAWLKLYDKPIFYFPRFFHPDPTVKRQSGFLAPILQESSSLGSSLALPYFHLISENKDLTFTPRFFPKNKFLLQTEYREVQKNSDHIIDFSYLEDAKRSSKGHIFTKSSKSINLFNFEESKIDAQFQYASADTYLKTYNLKSPIIGSTKVLDSKVSIDAYREDLTFDVSFQSYENLGLNDSDRYEYIYPNYNIVKKLDNFFDLNGNLSFKSSGHQKYYETNTYDKFIINDIKFNSDSIFTRTGIKNNYEVLIKNTNNENQTADTNKKKDNKIASIFQYNVAYPLQKKHQNYINMLNPKLSLKYSPNKTKDMSKSERRIDINNIYSFNRLSASDTVETGTSLTYGADFTRMNKLNKEILSLKIANSIRFKEEKQLPRSSNLNKKVSDIVGKIKINPNDILKLNFDFSIDENLKETNYQLLSSEFSLNNFVTTFEYLNENNSGTAQSYLTNKTSYVINETKNLSFNTRKNKQTKLTEFYNLIYQYSNDCLVAAVEYNKDYYSDNDLKPSESIYFKLTIIPLGGTSSPNFYKK